MSTTQTNRCVDCGEAVTVGAKRCRPCHNRYLNELRQAARDDHPKTVEPNGKPKP